MRFSQNFTPRTYFSVYTIKGKKFNEAKFGHKVNSTNEETGEVVKVVEHIEALGGYVVKIEANEGEYEGKTIKNLEIHLCDGDGSHIEIIKTARYGSFARDIIKKLAHLPVIGFVKLKPWIYTPEDNPKNMVKMCSVSHLVKYDGYLDDTHKVKCPKETFDFPKAIPIMVDGEQLKDSAGNYMWNTKERDALVDQLIGLCSKKLLYRSSEEVKIAMNGGSLHHISSDVVSVEEGFDDEVPF